MTGKEFDNKLVELLRNYLETDGFKYNKSRFCFELQKNNFVYSINWKTINRYGEFRLTVWLGIRCGVVEDIVNKFGYEYMNESDRKNLNYSKTLIVWLHYFMGHIINGLSYFVICTEDELENIIKTYFWKNYNTIKKFIEKYSNINEISKLVNKCVEKDLIGQHIFGITVMINNYIGNIVLSKLTNDKGFEKRYNFIKEKIKEYPEQDKDRFEKTYEYLKTI
jgi:hypothetical protein